MSKEFDESPEEYRISRRLSFISNQYRATIYMVSDLFRSGALQDSDIKFAEEQFEILSHQAYMLMNYAKVIQDSDL